ncbi:MAG: hypothetical protein MJ016_07710 [Victivallaceae bacterium]|nr:hypothetical protein [Victivallaceae bacterium]
MKFFRIFGKFFPLAAAILALTAVISVTQRHLADRGKNLQFSDTSALPEYGGADGSRAAVRFVRTALGSFRGIAADLLWLRAEALKQQGRHFELVQLSRWIIDLQPNYAGAVAYLGWNLAYNISVTTSDFAERWRWIREGIALFKERALVYNPEEPEIYRELAWIYLHKIGNLMDDGHMYYKAQLARSMMHAMGKDPDLAALAKAPKGEAGFFRAFASERAKLWRDDRDFSRFYRELYEDFFRRDPAGFADGFLPDDPALRDRIAVALRAERLRRTQRLEPATMVEIDRKYGALDWRVPESQAIYWAYVGAGFAKDKTPCERLINQALDESFRAGRIVFSADGTGMTFVPNLALGDAVLDAMRTSQETAGHPGAAESFRSARIYFLKQAIPLAFVYGQFARAERYYRLLVEEDGAQPDAADVESFIFSVWKNDIGANDIKRAETVISGLIASAIHYLLTGDKRAALSCEQLAQRIYRHYTAISGKESRTALPPYKTMKDTITRAYAKILPPADAAVLQALLDRENDEPSLPQENHPVQPKEN